MVRRSIIPRNTLNRTRVTGGISIGSAQPRQPQQEPVKSHAIKTDSAVEEMRQMYRTAISSLSSQLETLLRTAEDVVEQDHWKDAIEQLKRRRE